MKSSNLFWGFFFITFGGLYLLARYTTFIIDWYAIWELWPVLIILAGISIILKGTFFKPLISILFGILIAFFAFGFFNDVFDTFDYNNYHHSKWDDYSENYYNLDYDDSIKHVNLNIEAGAGKFYIENTTENLIKAYSKASIANYNFNKDIKDSVAWVTLKMDDIKVDSFGKKNYNVFKLSLNDNPTYSIDMSIGAAKSYFNLIPFKVNNLILSTGAADTKIKLGDKSEMIYVNVEMGAAGLVIYIPKSSGCKINGDMLLITKELDGFERQGNNYFITDNYETAKNRIIIEVSGAVASFKVKRY